jgi:hypothetical protein
VGFMGLSLNRPTFGPMTVGRACGAAHRRFPADESQDKLQPVSLCDKLKLGSTSNWFESARRFETPRRLPG